MRPPSDGALGPRRRSSLAWRQQRVVPNRGVNTAQTPWRAERTIGNVAVPQLGDIEATDSAGRHLINVNALTIATPLFIIAQTSAGLRSIYHCWMATAMLLPTPLLARKRLWGRRETMS